MDESIVRERGMDKYWGEKVQLPCVGHQPASYSLLILMFILTFLRVKVKCFVCSCVDLSVLQYCFWKYIVLDVEIIGCYSFYL